ncbi:MAG: hypothetical protein JSV89_00050 [Spirochaetaceae bacterium]|nr:MAG: hypothetical protein JSV89_00050 [Spirochaetaceae bacterium]
MRIFYSLSLLLLAVSVSVSPQSGEGAGPYTTARVSVAVPENNEARTKLEELFYAPAAALLTVQQRVLRQQSTGTRVLFQMQRQNGYLYYLFQNGEGSSIVSPGSYIIKRDLESGRFVQIKVFFRSDSGSFVRLFPEGNRTSMDVYLFELPVDRGVLLPLEFTSFLTEPFAKVIELSKSTVRWERLLYKRDSAVDELILDHVESIRRLLPALKDRDDGAMDADRRYVFIDSGISQGAAGGLNCSGFAKWVSDGFYYGLTGRYLDIEPLKEKHLELRGNRWSLRYEDERDPYFGLDWSRNLAAALWKALGYPEAGPEDFDVRNTEYLGYREDVGFRVEDLKLLLFLEASANPGHYYLGSVNREYGKQPVLRQHFHMVVLFPYFRVDGSFGVAVFDTNSESTLEGMVKRFPGAYVHLVRLPVGDSFVPPLPMY